LNKLFLHLALANGITSNPAKLCSWSIQLIQNIGVFTGDMKMLQRILSIYFIYCNFE
jgi:hypothetical protein